MSTDTAGSLSGGVGGGSDGLANFFYPLYERVFSDDSSLVVGVENKLKQARMSHTVEMYLSRALGIGVVAGLALWLIGTFAGVVLFTQIFDVQGTILLEALALLGAVVAALMLARQLGR